MVTETVVENLVAPLLLDILEVVHIKQAVDDGVNQLEDGVLALVACLEDILKHEVSKTALNYVG